MDCPREELVEEPEKEEWESIHKRLRDNPRDDQEEVKSSVWLSTTRLSLYTLSFPDWHLKYKAGGECVTHQASGVKQQNRPFKKVFQLCYVLGS